MRALALTAALTLLGGCFLFRDELPGDSCQQDLDCFRAQGEFCNLERRRCELRPPVPDAGPRPDAANADAGDTGDGGPVDGGIDGGIDGGAATANGGPAPAGGL